jgi:cold-inducible RNA-binding protein
MAKRLYVGGLSYGTTEPSFQAEFSKAGNVTSVKIIMDKMTGKSKGFGFIEFSNDDEAEAAINMFNGQEFEGRRLTVNEARPEEKRTGGNGGGGNGGWRN